MKPWMFFVILFLPLIPPAHGMNYHSALCANQMSTRSITEQWIEDLPEASILSVYVVGTVEEARYRDTVIKLRKDNMNPPSVPPHPIVFLINPHEVDISGLMVSIAANAALKPAARGFSFVASQLWNLAFSDARMMFFGLSKNNPAAIPLGVYLDKNLIAERLKIGDVALVDLLRLRFEIPVEGLRSAPSASPLVPDHVSTRIQRVIAALRADLSRNPDLVSLGTLAGMSRAVLYRHFKSHTGMGVVEFHRGLRMREARRLIVENHLSGAQAAASVGYNQISTFNRLYSQSFGVSPAADRERNRAKR